MTKSDLKLALRQISLGVDELTPATIGRRILVVSGRSTIATDGGARVTKHLQQIGDIEVWTYSEQFVTDTQVSNLLETSRRFRPHLIVGLGGGVALDFAKIAATYPLEATGSITDEDSSLWSTPRPLVVPLVLVPTLFGSGAEATWHSVIYRGGVKHSMAILSSPIVRTVLIPSLADSADSKTRLFAALDAVCQAVETSWSLSSTLESRELAMTGLREVLIGFDDYVNAKESGLRMRFVRGSNQIGQAMNYGKTTAPHALSYLLTAQGGVPHGHAVAVIMSYFWDSMSQIDAPGLPPHVSRIIGHVHGLLEIVFGEKVSLASWIREVLKERSLETNLKSILENNDIGSGEFLAACNENRLMNHPVRLTESDLIRVLSL